MERTAVSKVYTENSFCTTLWNETKKTDWLCYITITNKPKYNGLIPFDLNIPGYGRYKTDKITHKLTVSTNDFGRLSIQIHTENNALPYKMRIVQKMDE